MKLDSRLITSSTGEGPNILFLHGWLHSSHIWAETVGQLYDGFRCHLVDLPGFGNSAPLSENEMTIGFYTDLLYEYVESFSERDMSLIVADSLSAVLVLNRVSDYRALGAKILIMGAPYKGIPLPFSLLGKMKLIYPLLRTVQLLPSRIQNYLVKSFSFVTLKYSKSCTVGLIVSFKKADPLTAHKLFNELLNPAIPMPSNFNKPSGIYVLRGEYDKIFPKKSADVLSSALQAKMITIINSAHSPMIENTSDFSMEIKKIVSHAS